MNDLLIRFIFKGQHGQTPKEFDEEFDFMYDHFLKRRSLVEKVPELEALADLSTILHRKAYLVGFLKNVKPNGYIQAQIAGLTNTIRFRHKNLVNLIKVSAPFGEYVRPVLTCEEDEVFVGSDINSLENYTRTNFIADIDPKAIDILSDPDYDTHTQLGIYAGLMTEDEEAFFKYIIKKPF